MNQAFLFIVTEQTSVYLDTLLDQILLNWEFIM